MPVYMFIHVCAFVNVCQVRSVMKFYQFSLIYDCKISEFTDINFNFYSHKFGTSQYKKCHNILVYIGKNRSNLLILQKFGKLEKYQKI